MFEHAHAHDMFEHVHGMFEQEHGNPRGMHAW